MFRQDAYKVVAVLCRHERFALALNEAAFDQLFDDTGAGGGSAKPFLFGIIVELSIPRSLHSRQKGVFGVGLRRGCIVLGDAGIDRRENILLIQRRQRAFRLVLFLALERFLEAALNRLPSILHDRFAFCLELEPLTGERDRSLIIDVLLTGSAQKAHGDKPDDFLLRLRQLGEVLLFKLDGGDNGMMVSDLGVVGNSPDVRLMGDALEERQLAGDNADHLTGGALHILSDELTVRSGIGKQLFLIEGLHQIERLLGGKAIVAVGFPLQGGQIIEPRRVDRLRLLLERRNDGLLFIASRRNRLRLVFGFDLFQVRRQAVFADMDIEVFLLVEG